MAITAGSKGLAGDFIDSSAGAADAAKGVKLAADGKIDATMERSPGSKLMTLGEAFSSVTPPVAAYVKAADGKVWKASASADGETNASFVGFVMQTGVADDSKLVQATGIVAGFTGLTKGSVYFLSDTAGAISTTPGTIRKKVGRAISATEILLAGDDVAAATPPGTVTAYAGATAPSGWLLCNGASLVRTAYADLFAAISTTYGAADASHFTLPDIRGRVVVAKSTDTEFDALGETGGAKTHTLQTTEMPSHTHTLTGEILDSSDNDYEFNYDSSAHNNGKAVNPTTNATGGGGAHNNLQPYITLNYIIKY